MTYAFAPPNGFPQWEDCGNDPSIIAYAACTSVNNLGGAALSGAGAGSVTYSDNGIQLSATASLNFVNVLTAAQKAALVKGFTLTCWVESAWIADSYAGTSSGEHLMGMQGAGSYFTGVKGSGGYYLQGRSGSNISNTSTQITQVKNIGKGTHTRIDMVYYGGGKTRFYVDHLPATELSFGPPDTAPAANFIGLGGSTAGVAPINHRIKNFMICNRPVTLAVSQKFSHIAIFGHSFVDRGGYLASGDLIVGDTAQGVGEPGCLATIHRKLVQKGLEIPVGKIRSYGVSGSVVSGIATQITSATANGQRLKVALVESGANEVTASVNSFATDYPTWVATWQTQINSLVAAGADYILIGNVVSTVNASAFSAAAYQTRCNDANALIDSVIAANPTTCHKVDLFNLFGGHSVNSSDFLTDNIHPSQQGHNKIGKAFADKLISLL